MGKFQLPKDVKISMDGNTITLNRGVITYQSLDIDEKASTPLLVNTLKQLETRKVIDVKRREVEKDLNVLSQMGYMNKIEFAIQPSKILFIVNEQEGKFYKKNLPKDISILSADQISNDESFIKLNEIHDVVTNKTLIDNIISGYNLKSYDHIFWVDTYFHANRIRTFNIILKYLGILGTFSISDYSFLFVTTVHHDESGCFQCLENQIKAKLNNIEVLDSSYSNRQDNVNYGEKATKFGLNMLIVSDLESKGGTNTVGNVIELDTETKEYYFDSNRIQTTCTICSTQNNVFHEEQNMHIVELLKTIESGEQ
ncbi:hypothetical protein [Lactobacillus sp. ESL0681]|uniref:hypothetical protein n=1 Tax=Lactobacillus sp. ESL0681 TaxID=2983211 RepID=UPI0023F7E29C|nr:hypothetical protein [Lactobacillus sp. ESL0681]WEV40754.1 hypothetical protein OZX59_02230 [Lactobacillus sp. ESL0681]